MPSLVGSEMCIRDRHTDLAIRIRENRKMSRRSYHVIRAAHRWFIAIAARHDGCTTTASSDFGALRRAAPGGLFLLVALLQENDADLIAVDPGKLAAAVSESG